MKKVVFLDRDDTIIEDKVYLNDPNQIEYIDEIFPALKSLEKKGYHFIIVTNQSGVAKGLVDIENLNQIHKKIKDHFKEHGISILDIFYAPYASGSEHFWRKPEPGMLLEAKNMYQIDMSQSWMIGNRISDVEAGHRAGCKSILYLHNGKREDENSIYTNAEYETSSLIEAADFILKSSL